MRLRLMVRRHGLPDTPIVWVVNTTASPTISQLLEAVNEAIPIESDNEWGLEDYAVELKGINGANYECLHYQNVATVMKEDDEVIIRPLLTQDLKIRRVSGRKQISGDGKHLYDGVAFGRPLLRRADRPPVSIPPRKRRRILQSEEDENEDAEEVPALMEREEDSDGNSDANKQLVLHADFDDEDSEDDDEFVPGEDGDDESLDEEVDGDSDDEMAEETSQPISTTGGVEGVIEEQASKNQSQYEESHNTAGVTAGKTQASPIDSVPKAHDESVLKNVSDEAQRAQIRKLHAAFPTSSMAVCMHVFQGSEEDMNVAYEAMALGFPPSKSQTSFTESLEDSPQLRVPKTRSRSKAKIPLSPKPEDEDSMSVDDTENPPDSLIRRYDQGGFPPGSINAGKSLKFMAEAVQSSPIRLRSETKRSASIDLDDSVRQHADDSISNGLTSTPFIDQQSIAVESESSDESSSDESSEEEAALTSSDEDSDDDSSSDSDDSDDTDEPGAPKDTSTGNTSSSASDDSSDSSSGSSGEEEPEETSSKNDSTTRTLSNSASSSFSTLGKTKQSQAAPPGQGSTATKKRNERNRAARTLDRYKKKGVLPAGTTISELLKLRVNEETPPQVATAALEALRNEKAVEAQDDFERRRQDLLNSLASGGVEVGLETNSEAKATSVRKSHDVKTPAPPTLTTMQNDAQNLPVPESEPFDAPYSKGADIKTMDVDAERPSTAPGAPETNSPLVSPIPHPASAGPSQRASRRSKIDLGAGRRLLFGALGIKAPKTKQDEEKLRANLMKDVRPHVNTRTIEPSSVEVEQEQEEEAPDAWKEKIVYRAVECVQENIDLSEPPFPFVQRWDPQQQGVWSRNGKRKQDQREQPGASRPSKKQKRRKGKHNYLEEQEYLDASYEPSYQEPSYQEESMELQYDDTTQMTGLDDTCVDEEISMQLMNDIAGPGSQISPEVDDCVLLPEDMSTLEDLKDGDALAGMTIAFKKLDLSAATQWQPSVSSYLTAVVISIQPDGTLNLSLAMRDRHHIEKHYDEDGNRVYGKFETVDDDDELEEDTNFPNLTFGELIEAKILQHPTKDYTDSVLDEGSQDHGDIDLPDLTDSAEQDSEEAPLSHVTETPLHSEAAASHSEGPNSHEVQESIEMAVDDTAGLDTSSQGLAADSKTVDSDTLPDIIVTETAAVNTTQEPGPITPRQSVEIVDDLQSKEDVSVQPVSNAAKEQIAHLMKGTDFQAEPPSSVLRNMQPASMQSPGDTAALEQLMKEMTESNKKVDSPKFTGLGSSPIKKLRESSATPKATGKIQAADSSSIRQTGLSPQVIRDERRSSSSPGKTPQSSWETVDSRYQSPSPSPSPAQEGGSSWITEDSQLPPSSPPVLTPVKAAPAFKPLARRVPTGRAQALWEALQPKRKDVSSESEDEDESNENPAVPQVADRQDSNADVQYPKLSVGSSFTSQIADHGRQPDFDFNDDSLDVGTPRAADISHDKSRSTSPAQEPERQVSDNQITNPPSRHTSPEFDSDFEHPRYSVTGKAPNRPETGTWNFAGLSRQSSLPPPDPTTSDSDFLPPLESLSQSRTIKREKSRDSSTKSPKLTRTYSKKATAVPSNRPANLSEDEDQSTPKASQNRRSRSKSTKSRGSEKQASQSGTTAPRVSQPPPAGTQVYSLISSDDETDPQSEINLVSSEPDIPPPRFRRHQLDSDDDEEYDSDRNANKSKAAAASRRQTAGNLETASQTSLNTQNRRHTMAR